MHTEPIIIERVFEAPVQRVWQALTEKDKMKNWYFDLPSFKPEVGFEFRFYGGAEDRQYLHICQVTEVIPLKKLAYSWVYDGYPGYSVVSFELFEEGTKTRIKLTHSGLHTFPQANADFARKNFEQGWQEIIGAGLKKYVEEEQEVTTK